jgi:uncharacterized surface protein with fasciclin (FAS1) repeats
MQIRSRRVRAFALAAATALLLSACGADEPEAVEAPVAETPAPAPAPEAPAAETSGTIVEVAVATEGFSTLVAAVQAAGLVETLSGDGPFTVFAPTDAAFAALPAGVLDKLLLPENVDLLTRILTYHVLAGEVLAADVMAGTVATVEGSDVTIAIDGGVTINGAKVVLTDVMASNGVIHVIDAVILPPDVDVSTL